VSRQRREIDLVCTNTFFMLVTLLIISIIFKMASLQWGTPVQKFLAFWKLVSLLCCTLHALA
jgi:hypothetical protein